MTSAEWAAADITLNPGIIGVEEDTGKMKVGDGRRSWTRLPYAAGAASTVPVDSVSLESPNGTIFELTVDNAGQVSSTQQ